MGLIIPPIRKITIVTSLEELKKLEVSTPTKVKPFARGIYELVAYAGSSNGDGKVKYAFVKQSKNLEGIFFWKGLEENFKFNEQGIWMKAPGKFDVYAPDSDEYIDYFSILKCADMWRKK